MTRHQFRHIAGHLLIPLLMCVGMAFAYLGAFHSPAPNHLRLAVVGDSPQTLVLAQSMKDKGGDALDVVTLLVEAQYAAHDEGMAQIVEPVMGMVPAYLPAQLATHLVQRVQHARLIDG